MQEFADEILIYDQRNHKAYSLNETSSMIWQMCDGKTTVGQMSLLLAEQLNEPIIDEVIWLALDNFKRNDLLADNENFRIEINALSRRQVIKKVGLASMIVLPVILSIIAPTAAYAQSGGLANFSSCTANSQCQSGNCVSSPNPGSVCCASGAVGNGSQNQIIGCADPACADVNTCCSGSARPGSAVAFCTNLGATTCYCN